jgi:acyl dehydratase
VGLKQNASRPTGLAALRITTRDQDDRLVLDFWRCAMLPLSQPGLRTGHADELAAIGEPADVQRLADVITTWDLSRIPRPQPGIVESGNSWRLQAGDLVSSAPELARLTLNLAHVHHDAFSQPAGRLVYGGHTIGLALAQVTKTLPDLITVAAWHGCDHTGPVREGDTLVSEISIEDVHPLSADLRSVTLRVQVAVAGKESAGKVLDWKLVALSR